MKKGLWLIVLVWVCSMLQAQTVSSYVCGFENEQENAQWVLNYTPNTSADWRNKWAIGEAVASEGTHSMYVSNDDGVTASYGRYSRVMIAWRELTLEAGRYDLAFDWTCVGDSMRAGMFVAWVPQSDFDDMYCGLNDNIANRTWLTRNMVYANNGEPLMTGSTIWSQALDSLVSDGTPHRLTFVFVSSASAAVANPGACVDNVQLRRNNCAAPTQLTTTTLGQIAMFTWQSEAESFNLRFRRISDGTTQTVNSVTSRSYSALLPYGAYDIRVQTVCQGDTSVWYPFPVAFIFDGQCFNYLNLTNNRCLYSPETASDWHNNDPLLQPGKIDYGFLSVRSRHTIHYDPNEYDARTYNSIDVAGNPVPPLKTVPEGEIASVRIGSWEEWARVSRVVYDFTVDADKTGTLMIKYAMVLQSSGHGEADRPRFTLSVVDAETEEVLNECTEVDFSAKVGSEGWYNVPVDGDMESDRTVCWRDWTTVGMNLNDFDGRHVKVLLTAYGCTASIHYGYAYFVASCSSGKITGIQCGDTPTNEFIAPEGFNYKWYLRDDPNHRTISTEQVFHVDYRDTLDYAVDVINRAKPECYFTLTANAIPRYPIPQVTPYVIQQNCQNYVAFLNQSHIRTKNLYTGRVVDTNIRPDAVIWDFAGLVPDSISNDSIPWNPMVKVPNEEADYTFTLTAVVGLCDSTQVMHVHVPRAGVDSITETVQLCEGIPYRHKGSWILNDTVIIDTDKNKAGCDSVHITRLSFVSAIRDTVRATIGEGESYTFAGKVYEHTTFDSATYQSAGGCDSIRYLDLTVNERLRVQLTSVGSPCEEDEALDVQYMVLAGEPETYHVLFPEASLQAGWEEQEGVLDGTNSLTIQKPRDIEPNWYACQIAFLSTINGSDTVSAEIMVKYSRTIIQQRWDDVLGILNADYNTGHWEFVDYQWYKNGQPVEAQNHPYYYEEGGLTVGAEYAVLLVREGDSRSVMSCDFVPEVQSSAVPARSEQKFVYDGHLYIRYGETIYNAQGEKVRNE